MSLHPELSRLSAAELEKVRNTLLGLIQSIKSRMVITSHGSNLLKDEDITLQSLLHPERGDVLVTILRDHGALHIFLSNRRDAGSPFCVMDYTTMRRYPARRPVDSHLIVKEGDTALFLCTQQDRDMIERHSPDKISAYSIHFDVREVTGGAQKEEARDPLEKSIQEKWDAYRRHDAGDPAVSGIEKELFGFTLIYAKYRMPTREETIIIRPDKEKVFLGQLIRDIYPYNIRVILRKEDHTQHLQKLDDVHSALRKLKEQVSARINDTLPEPYKRYLETIRSLITDILEKDPQLGGFV